MTVPAPPPFLGAAAAANGVASMPSTGSSAKDIWGLGDLYNQPVLTGTQTVELPGSRMGLGDLPVEQPIYGKTQGFLQHVVELWAAQTEERKKFPNRLTTYEKLQRSLWQAGFYGQTSLDSIHVGQWTPQTQDALTGALGQYETLAKGGKLPLTFSEFLNQNATMGQDGGENGPGKTGSTAAAPPPFAPNLADPNVIRAAAQSAAEQALGRSLSEDQLSAFVFQFQSEQTSSQRAEYNQQQSTTPDLSAEAMQFAQEQNPKAYQHNQRTQYIDALVNMLGGNRPTPDGITPVSG